MEEKIITLLKRLIEKSKAKKAYWDKTSGDGFKISLSAGIVEISKFLDDGDLCYCIEIYNADTNKIYYYYSPEKLDHNVKLLKELYCLADGIYYKTEETYASLLDEIERKDVIGEEPFSFPF